MGRAGHRSQLRWRPAAGLFQGQRPQVPEKVVSGRRHQDHHRTENGHRFPLCKPGWRRVQPQDHPSMAQESQPCPFDWKSRHSRRRPQQELCLASEDPSSETFHGPSPFSEPEARNVKWLMDNFRLSLFLDLHSYAGDVLYTWGNDEDQGFAPDQNFRNQAYDGKRGVIGDAYGEYIAPTDYAITTGIALAVSDAMKAVRNRPYKPLPAVGLYPTSGTSDDYAFSRHIVDPGLA